MPDLFSPLKIGLLTTRNRVVMAPMTRCRAPAPVQSPGRINAEYYAQRSGDDGAGLIVSEATQVSPAGRGYPNTPGLHSEEQVAGWKLVTEAVHARGSLIFAQLWHVGRASHEVYQPDGRAPMSSSPSAKSGECALPDGTKAPYPTPRAMTVEDIREVTEQYRHAANNARAAGFDGVELHGANGYLPDQFTRDGVNRRTDQYGGSIENRIRFIFNLTRMLVDVWGADRVGVRLSPSGAFGDMIDSDPKATFGHLVQKYNQLPLAYLHIMEAMEGDIRRGKELVPGYEPIPVSHFRPLTRHTLITNAGFTFEKGQEYLHRGWADAIAFGIPFISNPDLTARFRAMASGTPVELAPGDPATFYWPGVGPMEVGYTSYPAMMRAETDVIHA